MGTTPEAKMTTRIVARLKKDYGSDLFIYKVHGGPMQRAGIPDISAVYKGISVWFEVKYARGKVSPLQEHTIGLLRRAGAEAHVVYCPEDCVKILTSIERRLSK